MEPFPDGELLTHLIWQLVGPGLGLLRNLKHNRVDVGQVGSLRRKGIKGGLVGNGWVWTDLKQ